MVSAGITLMQRSRRLIDAYLPTIKDLRRHGRVGFLPSSKINVYSLRSKVVTFALISNMMAATKQFDHACYRI